MAGSIAYPLKKAVIDGIAAHLATLDDFNGASDPAREVEVSYGFRHASHATERIFANRWRSDTPAAALRSGRNHRNESGEFELSIWVLFVGGDAEDAEERVDAIADEVETWLADRKNNELGVPGLLTLVVTGTEGEPRGGDNGAVCLKTLTVAWTARLT